MYPSGHKNFCITVTPYSILSLWLFVTSFGHWLCGESWHAVKDSLTHRPGSRSWAPGVLPFYVQVCCLYLLCTWGEIGWVEGDLIFSPFLLAINMLFMTNYASTFYSVGFCTHCTVTLMSECRRLWHLLSSLLSPYSSIKKFILINSCTS